MKNQTPDTPLFLLAQPASFTWEVRVRIPLDGKYGEARFDAVFPNLSGEQIEELVASDESGAPKYTNAQVADRVLLGFKNLQMPDGTELPFTQENKALVLASQRTANAVVGTFLAVTRGVAAEKNG